MSSGGYKIDGKESPQWTIDDWLKLLNEHGTKQGIELDANDCRNLIQDIREALAVKDEDIERRDSWIEGLKGVRVRLADEIKRRDIEKKGDGLSLAQQNKDFFGYTVFTLDFSGVPIRFVTEMDAKHVVDIQKGRVKVLEDKIRDLSGCIDVDCYLGDTAKQKRR